MTLCISFVISCLFLHTISIKRPKRKRNCSYSITFWHMKICVIHHYLGFVSFPKSRFWGTSLGLYWCYKSYTISGFKRFNIFDMPSLIHVLVAVHDVKMTDASNATIVFSTNYHTKYKNKVLNEGVNPTKLF